MASKLKELIEVSRVLSNKTDFPQIFLKVVESACSCLEADGGTLYLHDEKSRELCAVVAINIPLKLHHVLVEFNPRDIKGLFSLKLVGGEERESSVAAECCRVKRPIVIGDVGGHDEFDLSSVRSFDAEHGYVTSSLLAVPLLTEDGSVIGVLQLVNARHGLKAGDVEFVEAMASILGIAIENNLLFLGMQRLLNSVVEMISTAIDERSKVTGGHCKRVTVLTMMLAQAMSDDDSGPYRDFSLDEEGLRELRIAALIHDVGKIATPDQVLEKGKKLEYTKDNIDHVALRFVIRALELRTGQLERALEDAGGKVPDAHPEAEGERKDLEFIRALNTGGEFLDDGARDRLLEIAGRACQGGELIAGADLENLLVQRGTLNPEERQVMENHASISIRLLDKLPWPKNLAEVPEIAGKHHENCDGSGYPKGISGGDMSLRAKVLSLTDRFEGLSSPDRSYRKTKTLEQVMAIMQRMADSNQVDPELYRFFVESGVCMEYAREHLLPEQMPAGEKVTQSA